MDKCCKMLVFVVANRYRIGNHLVPIRKWFVNFLDYSLGRRFGAVAPTLGGRRLMIVSKTRTFMQRFIFACFALVIVLCFSATSDAGALPTVIVNTKAINPDSGAVMGEMTFPIDINPDDSFSLLDASFSDSLGRWDLLDLDVEGDIDPFTNLGFAVQNNMGFTVNFLVSVSVPIIPIPGATLHGGSSSLTVTDANASGTATVSALTGKSFYSGQIDGGTVLSLFSDPFSLTAGPPAGSGNATSTSLGLPATLPSGPALSTIGIVAEFSLTAGDSMSSTNFFRVEPVPEPATLALGGFALCLGLIQRRRK